MIAWLLLRRFSLRHWRMAPGQNAILVMILALGVAVFTAVHLANQSAVASFTDFTETLVGKSDWVIEAPAGPLSESVLAELRTAFGPRPVEIIPVVETTAGRPLKAGDTSFLERETYTVLGIDLIAVSHVPPAPGPAAGNFLKGRDRFRGANSAPVRGFGSHRPWRKSALLQPGDRRRGRRTAARGCSCRRRRVRPPCPIISWSWTCPSSRSWPTNPGTLIGIVELCSRLEDRARRSAGRNSGARFLRGSDTRASAGWSEPRDSAGTRRRQ